MNISVTLFSTAILLIKVFSTANCASQSENDLGQLDSEIFASLTAELKPIFYSQILKLQQLLLSLSNDKDLENSKCFKDVSNIANDLSRNDLWALRMLDAFAKPQPSLLTGNIMHIGSYDECLNIESIENEIIGKYCTVPINLVNNRYTVFFEQRHDESSIETGLMFRDFLFQLKSSVGICVPSSCNSTHLTILWAHLKSNFELDSFEDKLVNFNDDYCLDRNGNPLSTEAKLAIGVFAVIVATLVLSTLYDVLSSKDKQGSEPSVLLAFSVYTNGKHLFSKTSYENQLSCMNGLRVVSMLWIIFMHRVAISAFLPYINSADILELKDKYYSIPIFAAHFSVDTFFAVSGILLCYTYLNKRENTADNWPFFFVHRYLRLTPSLAAVILICATLTKHLGDGPFWPIVDEIFQKPCASSWWVDLLYLQNYIDVEHRCVTQAWYLAVDTQLYMLSPILLIPLIKFPKWTIIFSSVLTLISIGLNVGINFVNNYSANFFKQDDNYQNNMYVPTHTRYGPWLIGFIFGYILFKCKHKKIIINKVVVIILWTLSLGTLLLLAYFNWNFLNEPHNRAGASIYNGVCRQFWGLAVCWIIFACVHGYGGFVNKFLSLPIFNIAIRINYAMYLVHFEILAILIVRTRISGYLDILQMCHMFYGDLFVTFIVSVLWTLAFESPVIILEKKLLQKLANRKNNGKGQSADTAVSIAVMNNDKIR